MPRQSWHDLPNEVRAAVMAHTGPLAAAETVNGGVNSAIAVTLTTVGGYRFFLKGIPSDHSQVKAQGREASINPHVRHLSPRLLWRVETGGWTLLGYEHIKGRHADYRPGSPDLPNVAATLTALGDTTCPDIPLKTLPERFAEFAGDGLDLDLLKGDNLLHTDWAPDNLLINNTGAHLIDWAWPTRGPTWADIAALIVRLIEAGHTVADADAWARCEFPEWVTVPCDALKAYATAKVRLWDQIITADSEPLWKLHIQQATRAWADAVNASG